MSSPGDNADIFHTIDNLVAEERELRSRSAAKHGLETDERGRLKALEVELDQCWDLLRQRRAKAEFGEDPAEASVRPASEVEGYLS
ncbi:DUF2630 family protein [Streptomyces sp. NPDC057062]|uniref:DUF2630 family protein n=1 Tax=Streptomyces sp. NPDC057062 TaxID=3346011 RepID=UPI00364101D5